MIEPGFYWIRIAAGEDWEVAAWNGQVWTFIGTELGDDSDPAEIGARIPEPLT